MSTGAGCSDCRRLAETKKMNKVSIVVPAYNVEKHIHRAIRSVLEQSHENVEMVIVDDGSADGTLDVIKQYAAADPRIKWSTQENRGVSAARNRGLSAASGEYVLFLDGDDWLEPDAVSRLAALQAEHPDRLVCTDRYFAYLRADGSITRVRQRGADDVVSADLREAVSTLPTGEYNLQSACYKLFRRDRAAEIKFDESIHHGEDGLFVFDYLLTCKGLVFSGSPLWNILERPDSATQTPYNSGWLSAIRAAEIMKSREYDDASRKALLLNVVDRIEMVLNAILKSERFEAVDYRYAAGRLREYGREFCRIRPSVRAAVKYFCYAYLPPAILRALIRKKTR